ncbi:hypothetical protein LEM8419_03267 [Neolewinella maritima]|uniref:DUF1349 domain-containing protein n=2 Tax=Neolewinella maritima TaxID=1383882 RepID=A0ABM9B4S8_9BACT|nr:hypothetical protein LEM8419_03267 [Neolewinella maritima]
MTEPPDRLIPHLVRAGAHDYSPGHGFSLTRGVVGFELTFFLPESAWFDPSDEGPLGRDGKDWNKVGGISYLSLWRPGTYPKNRHAVLVGMRPGLTPGDFEVCAYTNAADGSWEAGPSVAITAGDTVHVEARIEQDQVTYLLTTASGSQTTVHRFEPLTYAVPVGPWFGGNRESPISHQVHTRLVLLRE